MKRKFIAAGFIAFSSLFLFSCSKDKGTTAPNPPGGGTTTPGPLFTAVRTVMQTGCAVTGCHAGTAPAGGLNFSTDNTIVAQKDRIKVRAVDQAGTANQMPKPPNAALSIADQKKITDWIAAGGAITN
ncbi:MAG TPA: hypothetical protein VM884_04820 [Flavisolibacter sp.]|nr:hypothetical protein [Flavisolibacter sp.]